MRIFKYKRFHQWARSEKLTDDLIKQTICEMNDGLFGVNLGGGLYKKRIARHGKGKSGGFRTIIVFKKHDRAIFVYGFAKNEKENMTAREKEVYKLLARYYLELDEEEMLTLIDNGELLEV